MTRPPRPKFTEKSTMQKVRAAEDGWNSCNPANVALAYTQDSQRRNRSEFINGRKEIECFLTLKWESEFEHLLIKVLWAYRDNRIAVRFAYEWHNTDGDLFQSYGTKTGSFLRTG